MLNAEMLWLADKLSKFQNLAYYDFYFTDETPEQMLKILKDYQINAVNVPANRTNGLYFKGGLN